MKKTLVYSLAALASLVLASCNEDFSDWADPQAYSQEDSAAAYGVTCTAGSEINCVMPDEDGAVNLVSVTSTSEDVASFAVNSITINGESIDASISDGELTVDALELSKLVETQYGSRAAVARDIEVVVSISIVLNSGDAVTGSSSTISGTFTPTPVPDISADGYYMLGDWQSWNLASPTVMEAQADGTYTATITTTSSGDNWYKFYRADTWSNSDWDVVNAGAMGCETNGDNSLSGFIVYEGDPIYTGGVQTPVISGASTFEVTFDPINLTYTIVRAEQMYYPTGTFNGWGSSEMNTILYPQGSNVFRLSTYYTASWDFKFWDNSNFGNWDVAYYGCDPAEEMTGITSGTIVYDTSLGCISSPAAGYYTCTIDMNAMTYSFEEIADAPTCYTSISLTGDFNSWTTDDPVEMTPLAGNDASQDYHNWYIIGCEIASDGGLKFLANHDWSVYDWGASVDISANSYGTGVQGGANITVPAGTYNIYLNDITGDFVFVAQ